MNNFYLAHRMSISSLFLSISDIFLKGGAVSNLEPSNVSEIYWELPIMNTKFSQRYPRPR